MGVVGVFLTGRLRKELIIFSPRPKKEMRLIEKVVNLTCGISVVPSALLMKPICLLKLATAQR